MSRRGSLICRLLKHSWVRLPTEEEAYRCLRCGKQIFGKLSGGHDHTVFTGGGGIGGAG